MSSTVPASLSADLDILLVGSWRSITRAPAAGTVATGSTNVSPYRWLNRSATSRVSSMCWRWSSPTGTRSVSYRRMSAACSDG